MKKRNIKYILVILLVAIFCITLLYKYFHSTKEKVSHLTVITYNIASGHKLNGDNNQNELINYFKKDNYEIIGLNEVDRITKRSNKVDQIKVLSNSLKYNYAFSKSIEYQGGQYGNGILSKYKIISSKNIPLSNEGLSEKRSILQTIINVNGIRVNIFVTHLEWKDKNIRQKQILQVKNIIESVNGPIILMGDFNTQSTDEVKVFLQKLNVIYGEERPITVPEKNTLLDYIFFSKDIKLLKWDIDKNEISDHYPVKATFEIKHK